MEECIKLAKYLCTNNIDISLWPINKLEEFGIPTKSKKSDMYGMYKGACSYGFGGYPTQRHDIERITIGNGGVGYYVADSSHHGARTYDEKMGYINITASFILELKGELLKLAHRKALEDLKKKDQEELKKRAQDVVTGVLGNPVPPTKMPSEGRRLK